MPPIGGPNAYRGRVLFLNFWASWCYPCRQEAPVLARFVPTLSPQKAAFVGVDVNDQRGPALRFLHRYRLRYPTRWNDGYHR